MHYFGSVRNTHSGQKSMQAFRTLFVCSFVKNPCSTAQDTITPGRYIRDGETLVSADGSFELGFFGKSKGQYLGIWYTFSTDVVVWVANRETQVNDSSGVLKITDQGILVLLNSSNATVWSSNSSKTEGDPVLLLLDSGNLVVKDENDSSPDNFLWQSFDHPCDTQLQDMKLGWNFVNGLDRYLSFWRSTYHKVIELQILFEVVKHREDKDPMDDQINDKTEHESICWINELPNCLLSSILSFLTIKDVLDTSMISRQLRHRWLDSVLTRPNLVFDIPNIFGSRYSGPGCKDRPGYHIKLLKQFKRQDFVRRVNQVLYHYQREKIDSFKVSFLFDGGSSEILDYWIRFAISKKVEELDLELFLLSSLSNLYVFPCTILSELKSSSTLKHLSLSVCALRPPPDFNAFSQLTSLRLDDVTVEPIFMPRLFSLSLLLESLTLSYCRGLGLYLIIPGPLLRLKHVKVICPMLRKIEISAENLASFEYGGHASLSFRKALQIETAYLDSGKNHTITYALNQFSLSPHLETLHLHIGPIEVPQSVSTFRNLKKLAVDVYMRGRVADIALTCVLNLLKATPLLEEFVVTVWGSDLYPNRQAVWGAEVYQTQQEVRNLSGFTHDHLKKVRIQGCQGYWCEIEFAICILNNTMKLETLIIDPFGKVCKGGEWMELNSLYGFSDLWGTQLLSEMHKTYWEKYCRAVFQEKLVEVKSNARIIVL